jgi:PLP dependent protein
MGIVQNLSELKRKIPAHVSIIAVSKTVDVSGISQAYDAGQMDFGENKVQEVTFKAPLLRPDIRWHFIGHLQTNKVRFIVSFIHMIHSIDSFKLLKEVDKEAAKTGRIVPCLLQIHIATEETKYGLSYEEACGILESAGYPGLKNIRVCGLMGMATYTDDLALVRTEFRQLREYFSGIKSRYFHLDPGFRELSMGMSGDFMTAVEEGSTMVRIGTSVFGERVGLKQSKDQTSSYEKA